MDRLEPDAERLNRAIAMGCAIQRWRDFTAHAMAYVVINAVFVIAWAIAGRGSFWPGWSLLGWGVGLSFQHFYAVLRHPIHSADVAPRMARESL